METRRYALFKKVDGKWVRESQFAYRKSTAVRVFQGALLDGALGGGPERCLKVVKEQSTIQSTVIA